jgi:hypothetical protein
MPTKLQQLRAEQERARRKRRSDYRKMVQAARKEVLSRIYGTLGPASPVRRIDPVTGEVKEILLASGDN